MIGQRKSLIAGLCLAGAVGGLGWSGEPDVPLTIATQNYGHTRTLQDGTFKVPGCAITYTPLSLNELNQHAFGDKKFDVTEVEILPYLARLAEEGPQEYVLVPVFLLREFQVRDIWIRTDRSINSPADLKGKTVAVPGYGYTGALWIRRFLQSTSTVKPEEMTWIDTEKEKKGAPWELLQSGRVDAMLGPGATAESSTIRRLFPDFRRVEQEEFKASRVFPIMTVLAVRAKLVEKNAWLPEALFLAFRDAKQKAVENLGTENEPKIPLPWGPDSYQESLDLMGKNYWSYGVPNNPRSLEALMSSAFEQGLIKKELKVSEIFDSSTLQLTDE